MSQRWIEKKPKMKFVLLSLYTFKKNVTFFLKLVWCLFHKNYINYAYKIVKQLMNNVDAHDEESK